VLTARRQIERVIELAGDTPATPVGALTSDNRDNWTDARAALLAADPANAASLEAIESAMIIVCLDDTKPVTREEISMACWVGNGRNRFYDKHQCARPPPPSTRLFHTLYSDRIRQRPLRLPG
jgi:carnitine O-acetyltransferase